MLSAVCVVWLLAMAASAAGYTPSSRVSAALHPCNAMCMLPPPPPPPWRAVCAARNPFSLAVLLISRLHVDTVRGVSTTGLLCSLQRDGWIIVDIDATVTTPDIRSDVLAAVGDAGVDGGGVQWSADTVGLLLYRPLTYHVQLWSGLPQLPATVEQIADDTDVHLTAGGFCGVVPAALLSFVNYPRCVTRVVELCSAYPFGVRPNGELLVAPLRHVVHSAFVAAGSCVDDPVATTRQVRV